MQDVGSNGVTDRELLRNVGIVKLVIRTSAGTPTSQFQRRNANAMTMICTTESEMRQ